MKSHDQPSLHCSDPKVIILRPTVYRMWHQHEKEVGSVSKVFRGKHFDTLTLTAKTLTKCELSSPCPALGTTNMFPRTSLLLVSPQVGVPNRLDAKAKLAEKLKRHALVHWKVYFLSIHIYRGKQFIRKRGKQSLWRPSETESEY